MTTDEQNILLAIQPKTDQLNADSLVGGPRTITITRVTTRATPEQPVSVYFEGDDGKPWKPCKSMMRLMVEAWSANATHWLGQTVELYLDRKVKWAGAEVGGIRIRAMSGIASDRTFAVTVSQGKREPMRVKRLDGKATAVQAEPAGDATSKAASADAAAVAKSAAWADKIVADINAGSIKEIEALMVKNKENLERLRAKYPLLADRILSAYNEAVKT